MGVGIHTDNAGQRVYTLDPFGDPVHRGDICFFDRMCLSNRCFKKNHLRKNKFSNLEQNRNTRLRILCIFNLSSTLAKTRSTTLKNTANYGTWPLITTQRPPHTRPYRTWLLYRGHHQRASMRTMRNTQRCPQHRTGKTMRMPRRRWVILAGCATARLSIVKSTNYLPNPTLLSSRWFFLLERVRSLCCSKNFDLVISWGVM